MALALMYHNIVETDGERTAFHPAHVPYVLTRSEFEAHLDIARRLSWRFLSTDDVWTGASLDAKALLLTFDDSWENRSAVEVIEAAGARGAFFLNTGELGSPGRLTAAAVARMAAEGHEIGSHGVSHEFLTNLSDADLAASLADSAATLEEISGKPCRFLSAPGGRYNARAVRAAREAGYEALFVSLPGFLAPVGRRFVVPRISISAGMTPERFERMLRHPHMSVLGRRLKYRLGRLAASLSGKHGGEGH